MYVWIWSFVGEEAHAQQLAVVEEIQKHNALWCANVWDIALTLTIWHKCLLMYTCIQLYDCCSYSLEQMWLYIIDLWILYYQCGFIQNIFTVRLLILQNQININELFNETANHIWKSGWVLVTGLVSFMLFASVIYGIWKIIIDIMFIMAEMDSLTLTTYP